MPDEPEILPFPERSEKDPAMGNVKVWEVGIKHANEHYSTIEIGDGGQLLIKATPTEVLRVQNSADGRGNPVYIVRSQTIVVVNKKPFDRREGE